jgi:hypothetical protein
MRVLVRLILPLMAAFLAARLAPSRWCAREAGPLFDGDAALHRKIALGLAENVDAVDHRAFSTGSALFDGEWWFGTFQMTALALDQEAIEHPEHRAGYVAAADRALDRLLSREVRAFDGDRWGQDPLDALDGPEDHAAYLGYAALALALHRAADPTTRRADLEQRVIDGLVRRFEAAATLLETYPGERYPVDNTAGLGAIGLHDRVTGQDHSALLARYEARYREHYLGPTGLLMQSVRHDGTRLDEDRGSGTFLAVYFLSFGMPALARDLWTAGERELRGGMLGFGMMREYRPGIPGDGDIDSGPVILGYGVSATGFAIGAARTQGDFDAYADLYATAALFGGPQDSGTTRHYVAGGPLGDAILGAMLTAPRAR